MIKNSPSPTVSNTHTHLHIQICFVIWDFLEIHMIAKVTDMLDFLVLSICSFFFLFSLKQYFHSFYLQLFCLVH